MKCKNFCKARETTNKMKRQPSDWEKIFANKSTDKGLISEICKQLCSSMLKKHTTQSKNGQKTYIDISPKKTYRCPRST